MNNRMEVVQAVHDILYFSLYYHETHINTPRLLQPVINRNLMKIERNLCIMAKNGKTPSPEQKPAYEQIRWVNRNLSDEDKFAHDQAKIKPEQLLKELSGLVLTGYNFALKYDAYSSCYQATLIPYNPAHPNTGYGLSARSGEPLRAVSLLLWKHFQVLREDWAASYVEPKRVFEG